MTSDPEVAPPTPAEAWTTPGDYFGALARRRTARRSREPKPRTQPERPRLLLSTLPFLALIIGLALLSVAIMVAAWPGTEPPAARKAPPPELGTASKGWFQEAQKEFH